MQARDAKDKTMLSADEEGAELGAKNGEMKPATAVEGVAAPSVHTAAEPATAAAAPEARTSDEQPELETGTDDVTAENAEEMEAEDQQASGEQMDMRANDPACLLCDDGGNIVSCDGTCMRSFHIGITDANEYDATVCNAMRMPEDLARTLIGSTDPFLCPHCLSCRHNCFKCGKAGASDPMLPISPSTVKRCAIFECGRFYHPECIGRRQDEDTFVCPLHVCAASSSGSCQNADPEEPLIECRRCPVAYHEDCIPLSLWATRYTEPKRVWLTASKKDRTSGEPGTEEFVGDPVDRSLIYCMNHDIPAGECLPPHERPIFSQRLLDAWDSHYAKVFPELEWSKQLMAKESLQAPGAKLSSPLASPKKSRQNSQQPFAGPPDSNQAPPVKRRRLVKAVEAEASDVAGAQEPARALEASESSEDGSQSDSDASLLDFEKASYWTEEAMAARQSCLLNNVSSAITLDSVRSNTRMPEPYAMPFKKTITQERLQGILKAFSLAKDRPWEKDMHVTPRLLNEIRQQEENMRTSLACYLHTDRYSSYGRHFTNPELLRIVTKKLEVFIKPKDTVIDFSCGYNHFIPMLKRYCLTHGKEVACKAFDIITPCIGEDFQQISWFDVKHEHLGASGDNLVIGLNPPYGLNNALAMKFLDHAACFNPRIIVLIVPPATHIPRGYSVVLEDRQTMADKAFYIPGLVEHKQAQWNKVTPAFRILARSDSYPLSDRLHAPHMGPVARAYQFHTMPPGPNPYFGAPPVMPMGAVPFPGYDSSIRMPQF